MAIRDLLLPGDVLSGQRTRRGLDLVGRSAGHHFAAVTSRARAEIDHVIGAANRVFVVLDHQHGVAQIAQRFQRLQQAIVVAMMQSDRRLIQHIQHAAQLRANLRRQPNALAFAAAQRRRRAVERDVAQPDGVQEAQPLGNLLAGCVRQCVLRAADSLICAAASTARDTGSAVKSAIDMPFTFTARLSGRRRLPWQAGQVVADM